MQHSHQPVFETHVHIPSLLAGATSTDQQSQQQQHRSVSINSEELEARSAASSSQSSEAVGGTMTTKASETSTSPFSAQTTTNSSSSNFLTSKEDEWHNFGLAGPSSAGTSSSIPRVCAYHDCVSLAAAWNLGYPTTKLESHSSCSPQAPPDPSDDLNEGKSNEILAKCPTFRNEIGFEPIRQVALSSRTYLAGVQQQQENNVGSSHLSNGCESATLAEENLRRRLAIEGWQREHTAADAGVLEDVSNVYLGGRLCAARQPKIVIEPQDIGSYYYRHCFTGRAHLNFFGTDELGPIAVSMVKEFLDRRENGNTHLYRLIIRVSDLFTMRVAVPEDSVSDAGLQEKSSKTLVKELLELACPQINFASLRPALATPKVEELLTKIDEQPLYHRYKVGVLYCASGQSTEEQMYNNEDASPAFEEFLDFLGTRVRLKGFDSYKGGLDTRSDTTGKYSVYTEYHSHEIMFHISTMLPFTPNNKQQLSRKRHIGNDMVTIIFQEPDALPFYPTTVRSHFQHVFIVVRVTNPLTPNVSYSVAVARAKDVPSFGPPILLGGKYTKSAEFHDFLMTKIINGENAVHRSKKFAAMAARTRREALKDLAENYVAPHAEGPSRIASRILGGSVKRKERQTPSKLVLDSTVRGALSWEVEAFDYSVNQKIYCVIGISGDWLVLLDSMGVAIFSTPTHAIFGWSSNENGLKIFYDHGDMLLIRTIGPMADRDLAAIVKRLSNVTNGEEGKEITLRKNKTTDTYGFKIQEEGIVTDVDMYQVAWKGGLRQGSRIVELELQLFSRYTLEQINSLLMDQCHIRVRIVPAASDGNPRRGCEDSNCPSVRNQEALAQMRPDSFTNQPLSFQEIFRLRNRDVLSDPASISSSFEESQHHSNKHRPTYRSQQQLGSLNSPLANTCEPLDKDGKKISAPVLETIMSQRPINEQNGRNAGIWTAQQTYTQQERPMSSHQLVNRAQSDDPIFSSGRCDYLGPSGIRATGSDGQNSSYGSLEPMEGTGISGSESRHLSMDDELSKQKWRLQKLLGEKHELLVLNEHLNAQLQFEKRAHEVTRRRLEAIQEYCDRYQVILPVQFEEEDEEL